MPVSESVGFVPSFPKISVGVLRDLIKEKGINHNEPVLAKDITLWKVRMMFLAIRSDIMGDTTLACRGYPYQASYNYR